MPAGAYYFQNGASSLMKEKLAEGVESSVRKLNFEGQGKRGGLEPPVKETVRESMRKRGAVRKYQLTVNERALSREVLV